MNQESELDEEEAPFNVDAIWKREFSSIFKSEFTPDLWGLEKCGDGNGRTERPIHKGR